MDASQISVENVAAIVGVGIVSAWLAAKKYLSERKTTMAQESADLAILAGGSITDMRPVREVVESLKAQVIEQRRIADALERMVTSTEHRDEEDEIERRAKARAAEMVASEAQRRHRT